MCSRPWKPFNDEAIRGRDFADEAQQKPDLDLPEEQRLAKFLWFCFGFLTSAFGLVFFGVSKLFRVWILESKLRLLGVFCYQFVFYFNYFILYSAYHIGLCKYNYHMGRYEKFTMDVITLCLALTLQWLLGYDIMLFMALVSYTMEFHAVWKLLHGTCDFGFWDVLVEASMQSAVYLTSSSSFHVSAAVLLVCAAVIFYRWCFYLDPLPPRSISQTMQSSQLVNHASGNAKEMKEAYSK